jgi:hypothetical protein
MRQESGPWVVYVKAVVGSTEGKRYICEQSEWDALYRAKPGEFTLVREGITNEGEAERLARGTLGDRPKDAKKNVAIPFPFGSAST